jgi:signal transduction histidine kinase
MADKIHNLNKKLIELSQMKIDYREFIHQFHILLSDILDLKESLFILKIGNFFLKSSFENSNEPVWIVRTNEADTSERFKKLAEIAMKEGEFKVEDQTIIKSLGQPTGIIALKEKFQTSDRENIFNTLDQVKDLFYLICKSLYRQFLLNERVKELSCLHSIRKLSENKELDINQFLTEIVKLLPPAWQYSDYARARISYNNEIFSTKDFQESEFYLKSDIITNNLISGSIEINYPENFCNPETFPFLKEEKDLLQIITSELNIILEKKMAEVESKKLEKQLLHADRLVTLGQLSAGIAHEINEPLAGILGLAQLMEKNESLNEEAKNDLENIVSASLHARDVVKKLMLFARQMPASQSYINLNDSVKNAAFFLESRCRKNMIELKLKLAKDLPQMIADSSQIHQVLINLIVNALQAMPKGGVINLTTDFDEHNIYLNCSDNGTGMNKSVLSQIFNPFFTTKKVNEGTGLGLSVVHGIIYSHQGNIKVKSAPGKGTTFKITFPRIIKDG